MHAFPFHAARFYNATNHWNNTDRFIYLQVLTLQWQRGGLPDCPSKIARLIEQPRATFVRSWNKCIRAKFDVVDGKLFNRVVEDVREKETGERLDRRIKRAGGITPRQSVVAKGIGSAVGNSSVAKPKRQRRCVRLNKFFSVGVRRLLERIKSGSDAKRLTVTVGRYDVLAMCRFAYLLEKHGVEDRLWDAMKYAHAQQQENGTDSSMFWRQVHAWMRHYFVNVLSWSEGRFNEDLRAICFRSAYLDQFTKALS